MNPFDWQLALGLPDMAPVEDFWIFGDFQCTSKSMKGGAYDKISASAALAVRRGGG